MTALIEPNDKGHKTRNERCSSFSATAVRGAAGSGLLPAVPLRTPLLLSGAIAAAALIYRKARR